jgi:sugar/nucleoside kinase (ribokinase family)
MLEKTIADAYRTAKTFNYTTTPLRAGPTNLSDTSLLHAKAFHFFGPPQEILAQVPELLRMREARAITARPFLVWEPLPASCKPENLEAFEDACKLVDVFSPNHLEIAALFSDETHSGEGIEDIERMGQKLLDAGIGLQGDGAVIIRAGEDGAIAMVRGRATSRLPAFYEKGSPKVVDVTGAGNAFLGGYIAGWLNSRGNMEEAMSHGHVAASFALEQIGLPNFIRGDKSEALWNGESAMGRLEEYKRRVR